MPQYCPSCALVFEGARCPACGNKKLRAVLPEDVCFLAEKEFIWAGMLTDVLEQKGIPFVTKNMVGAGLTMRLGAMAERVRVYVPFARLDEAQAIVEELFSLPPEDAKPEEDAEAEQL